MIVSFTYLNPRIKGEGAELCDEVDEGSVRRVILAHTEELDDVGVVRALLQQGHFFGKILCV